MFGDASLDNTMGMFPWVAGASAVFVILFIFAKVWKATVSHKVANQTFTGMTVQDIDKMRRDGIISEAEYKTIRHKAAERELESLRHKEEAERERLILSEAAINPDAARKLLKPEQIQKPPVAEPRIDPVAPQAQQQEKPYKMFDWGDPLASVDESPTPAASAQHSASITHPQPGKIRVPPPQAEKTAASGELELLLEKGVITREDYERFKAMAKK